MKKTSFLFITTLVLGLYGCGNKIIETETFCFENISNDSINFSANICVELTVKGKKAVVDSINKILMKEILNVDYEGFTPSDAIKEHIVKALEDYHILIKELPDDALTREHYENINGLVTFLNADYLCYRYDSELYSGGAHPLENTSYIVFDLKTGQKMTEEELCKSNLQDDLSKIVAEILSDNSLYPENATYDLEALKLNGNFSFEPDSLIYTFNEYEIAPYSSGKIDVKIPYTKIKDIIKIDLSQLVK